MKSKNVNNFKKQTAQQKQMSLFDSIPLISLNGHNAF